MHRPIPIRPYRLPCSRIQGTDGQLSQRNAMVDGTHVHAQVAADALLVDHFETALAVALPRDRLMRGVLTRDIAAAALDAKLLVDARLDRVVQIEMLPVHEVGHRLADEIGEPRIS